MPDLPTCPSPDLPICLAQQKPRPPLPNTLAQHWKDKATFTKSAEADGKSPLIGLRHRSPSIPWRASFWGANPWEFQFRPTASLPTSPSADYWAWWKPHPLKADRLKGNSRGYRCRVKLPIGAASEGLRKVKGALKSCVPTCGRRRRVAQARDCKSRYPGSIPGGASIA